MAREPYRFDGYLAALGEDWLADDALLQRWLARGRTPEDGLALVRRFGRAAATELRASADRVERRDALPRLEEPGPWNERARRIVLPDETHANLAALHGSGIWREATDERARYAVVYLLNQNGEAGLACSAACTDGLARALRALGDDSRSRAVVEKLESATPDSWVHGAQFVTEIQGGSDAATNALRATPGEGGLHTLHGPKWFCSNATADYWLVTGRVDGAPPGHRGVSLFCVPRLHEGSPNGHTLVRLKEKLGTRALPTAEIEFEGALGWPVGALDAGLRNMVAIVLTTSRIHCILAAAAASRRAAREAEAYTGFREAFGRKLADHPLVGASVRRIREGADLAEAGAFATVDAWLAARSGADDTARLWARVLVSLAKAVSARASTARVYEAMMLLGGNGVEERFNGLPRLWRDAAIIEAWEGPYTLLLMQALEDLTRYRVAGREEAFLRFGLGDQHEGSLAAELARILATPDAPDAILAFGELAPRLYARFEARALAELR